MIHKIFSVYDSKAVAYLQPMFFRANGEAIRAFSAAAQKADHEFSRFAEDYTLFELGEFDDVTGSFNLLNTPVPLGKAIEFRSSTNS